MLYPNRLWRIRVAIARPGIVWLPNGNSICGVRHATVFVLNRPRCVRRTDIDTSAPSCRSARRALNRQVEEMQRMMDNAAGCPAIGAGEFLEYQALATP